MIARYESNNRLSKAVVANGFVFLSGITAEDVSGDIEAQTKSVLKTLDEEKTVARRLNNAALDHVVYAPFGFFLRRFAWRKSLTGGRMGRCPFSGASVKPLHLPYARHIHQSSSALGRRLGPVSSFSLSAIGTNAKY
jgi:hypothetical protein